MKELRVDKVWVDDHAVYVSTTDGQQASYEFSLWPRLAHATQEQREQFELSYSKECSTMLVSVRSAKPKTTCFTLPSNGGGIPRFAQHSASFLHFF